MRAPLAIVALLGSLTVCMSMSTTAQNTPQAATPIAGAGMQISPFIPGFDDLMTMLVQPRHSKLYYAGIQRNWELAAFEVGELRSAFRRIAQMYPKYADNSVDDAFRLMMEPKLQAMDAAIAAADSKRFLSVYGEITAGCNSCHIYMERPFLIIKVPNSPANAAYADQDFRDTRH